MTNVTVKSKGEKECKENSIYVHIDKKWDDLHKTIGLIRLHTKSLFVSFIPIMSERSRLKEKRKIFSCVSSPGIIDYQEQSSKA